MYASLFGQVDAVRVLLDKSATLEKDDKDGTTPLMYASQCGSAEVVRVLLGKGARLEAADRGGKMALQYAAENKHSEVVGVLIEAGLAAGQDANACYSVISVYLCMGVCS
jgi:ankyrin repeat protein